MLFSRGLSGLDSGDCCKRKEGEDTPRYQRYLSRIGSGGDEHFLQYMDGDAMLGLRPLSFLLCVHENHVLHCYLLLLLSG